MPGFNLLQRLRRHREPVSAPTPVSARSSAIVTAIALEIARTGRYDMLDSLDQVELGAVVAQLAARLDDPGPLFAFLWRNTTVSPEYFHLLAECLRAVPLCGAFWPVRVVTALGEGRAGPVESGNVLQALLNCLPALDSALDEMIRRRAAPRRFLRRLFDALSIELAAPRLMRLAFDAASHPTIAWDAADRLAAIPEHYLDLSHNPPVSPEVRARWCYVGVMGGMAAFRSLATADALASLAALVESEPGRAASVARSIALDEMSAPEVRLAALELVRGDESASAAALAKICRVSERSVRNAAVARLCQSTTRESIAELVRLAMRPDVAADVRFASVMCLCEEMVWDVAPVLQRCTGDESLPLAARMRAAAALGRRIASRPRALTVIRDRMAHAEVRAAAARGVSEGGIFPEAPRLLLDAEIPPPLAVALCGSFQSASDDMDARTARVVLSRLLERSAADIELTLAALAALGNLGGDKSARMLAPVAGAGALARLQGVVPPEMLLLPARECLANDRLPARLTERLAVVMAIAPTVADQPATLSQFLMSEAARIANAALMALAVCGGGVARDTVDAMARTEHVGGLVDALTEALDALNDSPAMLRIFADPASDPALRWHIRERLMARHDGAALLRSTLQRQELDEYGCELAIDGLATHDVEASAALLMGLAEDVALPIIVRERALMALASVSSGMTEHMLVRLLSNPDFTPSLRGMAAASLPSVVSGATCRLLRDLARGERPPDELLVGILRALGRASDPAASAIMLRYSDDEHPDVAREAIEALSQYGDPTINPSLIQVALNPHTDVATKLCALEALSRLGDDEAARLLRPYLSHGSTPLRMRAFDTLARAGAIDREARLFARDRLCPAPLRLRALAYLAEQSTETAILAEIVGSVTEDPALRAAAAHGIHDVAFVPALADVARNPDTPSMVRAACVVGLERCGGVDAWLALGALALDSQDAAARSLATRALHAMRERL